MSKKYIDNAKKTFNIDQWSNGHFDINESGELEVVLSDGKASLQAIVEKARQQGATFPLLLRFKQLLEKQVDLLRKSFQKVAEEIAYSGSYLPVYPIKVNQQEDVVSTLSQSFPVGLEAGSKPELLLAIAHCKNNQVLICNGYKDKEFIDLASLSSSIGQKTYVVIEKPHEAQMLLQLKKEGKQLPAFGVRVRLSSIKSSHWQNSGGPLSKFGLSALEACQLIEELKKEHALDKLTLLHFHIGSQIANVRDIRLAMKEAAQWYRRLRELGAPLEIIDVGGGLGVDYLGTANRHHFSKNYNEEEYARAIMQPLKDLCSAYHLPLPNLMSESGRAMTAHHGVLVTNMLSIEPACDESLSVSGDHFLLREFEQVVDQLTPENVVESYHEGLSIASEVDQHFIVGDLSLEQKAYSQSLCQSLYKKARSYLSYTQRQHREIIDDINTVDVKKVLCNFSVFQSLPDAWAISQIFPIMPLTGLHKPLQSRCVLHDLTCDSDGQVKHYVTEDGIESSFLLPELSAQERQKTYLGFFLVGAYQEILGDIHNLFGDQDSAIVDVTTHGDISITKIVAGENIAQIIQSVGYQEDLIEHTLFEKTAHLRDAHKAQALIKKILKSSTYLSATAFDA